MNTNADTKVFQTIRHILTHTVEQVRHLNESTFVIRCSRNGLSFTPGQHLCVGPKNDFNMREYSVYSGENEDFLEILVKEVTGGLVSKELKKLKQQDEIKIEGPFGFFTIEPHETKKNLYMIATGTGISPFHCFALSYPHLSFTVLHGVRNINELYEHGVFNTPQISFIPCISQEPIPAYISQPTHYAHAYQGRVTTYLQNNDVDPDGVYFLCGNCDMIYEVFDILQQKSISPEHIKAEVYF